MANYYRRVMNKNKKQKKITHLKKYKKKTNDEDDLKWECFDLEAYINNVVTFALNKTLAK